MRKFLLFFISVFAFTALVKAQDNCMSFFPTNKGAILISKSYDAKDNLLSTMTYRILKSSDEYIAGEDLQIGFVMTDAKDNVIDLGNLEARCDGENFFLSMVNRNMTPDVMDLLGEDTELVGDFLDYPNINPDSPFDGNFAMNGGEFTVRSKTNKNEFMKVTVYNRQYEKDEKITTPAGAFDASKITFTFDVYKDKKTTTYSGAEWFADGAGIVRSETRDNKNNLINYTVLTTLQNK